MRDQTIRPITPEDWPGFVACIDSAFGWTGFSDEQMARFLAVFEMDRSLGTFDGDLLVGTAGAFSRSMGVPGGVVPLAAVTCVSVRPTHRRQGVLTRMMTRQLHEVAEAGDEAVAGLWASEPAIYQRWGYGLATWQGAVDVRSGAAFSPRGEATLARHGAPVRLVPEKEGVDVARGVLDAAVEQVPGLLRRTEGGWDRFSHDDPGDRGGASERFWAVTEGAYATYRLVSGWDEHSRPEGSVQLGEIHAVTPEAYAALWRWLLDLDLMRSVGAPLRPVQDPLLLLLRDSREASLKVKDGLWLRLVDVPRALAERTFSAPLSATLLVHDPLLPANDGLWHVEVDDLGAAEVTRGSGTPDLELTIADLSAAHLGATGLGWLARAGGVVEHTPGALRAAARAWAWDVPATSLEIF